MGRATDANSHDGPRRGEADSGRLRARSRGIRARGLDGDGGAGTRARDTGSGFLRLAEARERRARLKRALKFLYDDDPNLDQISAEELAGDYPAVEYVPPHGRYSIDILTRLGEAFRYETLDFEELLLDGIRIRVATPTMLYRMKKDTVRPQDRLDAETIRQEFGLDEED